MTTTRVSVSGVLATSFVLYVPPVGPWWADVVLDGDSELSGRVDISVGESWTLRGTVVSRGVFGSTTSLRVVAGAAGWSTLLSARSYHSDSGVSARLVAGDAALSAGEMLASFSPSSNTLGVDYVRQSGPASVALEAATGGAAWWVDFDGNTNVGTRSRSTLSSSAYALLEFDPISRVAVLEADDLSVFSVGSVLAAEERMPTEQVVRELRIEVNSESARVVAWCGDLDSARGRLARSIEAIVRHILKDKVYGAVRYRVMGTRGDRVELQAISAGYPDVGPVSYAPGVGGTHAELQVGAEVLVEFVEGDPTMPRVTHYAGKDGVGWVPVSLTLEAQTLLKLGANAAQFVALAQDTKARLDSLQNAHDTHKHPTAGTGPPSPPDVIVGPLGPIAATKVKAE